MSLACGYHLINPVCTDSVLFLGLQFQRQCFGLGSLTSQLVILADTFHWEAPPPRPLLVAHWSGFIWRHLDAFYYGCDAVFSAIFEISWGGPCRHRDRQGNEPWSDEKENSVQLDFTRRHQTSREPNARWFIASIFKYNAIWDRVSWCNTNPSAWGGVITSELFTKHTLYLLRRWIPEISYLY